MSVIRDVSRSMRFIFKHPLGRRRPAGALLRYVRWQIASRLHQEVTVPWIGNVQFVAARGMTGATGNIYCGLHEYPEMAFALHLLRSSDLFFDAGANIGSYTLLVSGVVGARSIAVEPAPETAAKLRRNIVANKLVDLVEIDEFVLGRRQGDVVFTMGQDSTNRVAGDTDAQTRSLPMSTIDLILQGRCPTLIKIDLEGHEEEAFVGAEAMLADSRLQAVCTELYSGTIANALERLGFTRVYYDPALRRLSSTPNGVGHTNALLVRDIEWASGRLAAAPKVSVFGIEI